LIRPFLAGRVRSRNVARAVAAKVTRRKCVSYRNPPPHVGGYSSKDWIIYFQSDEVDIDFIVWVYPQKIMVTEEYADTVRNLIKAE